MTYDEVIAELQRIANPKSKKDFQNHGANENIYGVGKGSWEKSEKVSAEGEASHLFSIRISS